MLIITFRDSIPLRRVTQRGTYCCNVIRRCFEAACSNLLENDVVNGIIINSYDISERKDAEIYQKEIYRLDQLNTIGQMAAGIGGLSPIASK